MQTATWQFKDLITKLDFNSVFKHDLIVHACADLLGTRIVSIENIDIFSFTEEPHQIEKAVIGKGTTVEHAMEEALRAFHEGLSYDEMYPNRRAHPKGSNETTGNLDHWLIQHKGKMSVAKDEDGTMICTLAGLKEANNPASGHMSVHGTGANLRLALRSAFNKLEQANEHRIKAQG
jgi:hypothetical protein